MNIIDLHKLGEEAATFTGITKKAISGPAMGGDKLGVSVAVTDITGSLDVTVEWSPDGTNFGPADTTPDALAQITTTVAASKSFDVKAPYFRLKYTITTGPVTFVSAAVN